MTYPALLRSVFEAVGSHRRCRSPWSSAATFDVHPVLDRADLPAQRPAVQLSVCAIGLVGWPAWLAPWSPAGAGRLHDRGWSVPVTGAALALALASLVLAGVGQTSIVVLLVAIVAFDIAAGPDPQPDPAPQHQPSDPQPHEHRLRHRQLHRRRDRFGPGRGAWQAGGWTAASSAAQRP